MTPMTPMTRRSNVLLWTVQALLASLFLFAGSMKLILPPEAMAGPVSLPIGLLRFIGVCEVLGAVGLILPGLTGIRRGLTPLAAVGLVIIMMGATVISAIGTPASAMVPLVVGGLAVVILRGRRAWLPGAPLAVARELQAAS